jgi:hypothetical protein
MGWIGQMKEEKVETLAFNDANIKSAKYNQARQMLPPTTRHK